MHDRSIDRPTVTTTTTAAAMMEYVCVFVFFFQDTATRIGKTNDREKEIVTAEANDSRVCHKEGQERPAIRLVVFGEGGRDICGQGTKGTGMRQCHQSNHVVDGIRLQAPNQILHAA